MDEENAVGTISDLLTVLAIPIVITAGIIYFVANRIADYFCGDQDVE